METSIIKIGNSQGLIIPKRILSRFGAQRKVEINFRNGKLLISPVTEKPRNGWAVAFAKAVKGEDSERDYFKEVENNFDKEEWTW
jgi:antitoxin MazE